MAQQEAYDPAHASGMLHARPFAGFVPSIRASLALRITIAIVAAALALGSLAVVTISVFGFDHGTTFGQRLAEAVFVAVSLTALIAYRMSCSGRH